MQKCDQYIEKNVSFFPPKVAENCDHNIDPGFDEFSPKLCSFLIAYVAHIFGLLFPRLR
jgi:hypothetical protein